MRNCSKPSVSTKIINISDVGGYESIVQHNFAGGLSLGSHSRRQCGVVISGYNLEIIASCHLLVGGWLVIGVGEKVGHRVMGRLLSNGWVGAGAQCHYGM